MVWCGADVCACITVGCAEGYVNNSCVCVNVCVCPPLQPLVSTSAEGSAGIYAEARANLARQASVLLAGTPYIERQTERDRKTNCDSLSLNICSLSLFLALSALFCIAVMHSTDMAW